MDGNAIMYMRMCVCQMCTSLQMIYTYNDDDNNNKRTLKLIKTKMSSNEAIQDVLMDRLEPLQPFADHHR